MDDKHKSKKELIKELEGLRQRVSELEEFQNENKLLNELEELEKEHSWPEKALHDLEQRYQALVETNLYGIQEIDIYGIITFMNSVQYKILGYSIGELKGKQIWDLLASDADRDELTDYLTRVAEGEYTSFPWTGKYLRKDDRIIELQVDWKYRQDAQGRITGFVSVISGILGQKYPNGVPEAENLVDNKAQNLTVLPKDGESYESSDDIPVQISDEAETSIPEDVQMLTRIPDLSKSMELKLDEIQQQLNQLQQTMLKSEQSETPDTEDMRESEESDKAESDTEASSVEGKTFIPKDILTPLAIQLAKVLQRMDILHQEFETKFKYDTHKNKIIDNLHQDLQDYKNDFLKKYLKSIIMDVIQIIDNIRKLANHYSSKELSEDDAFKLLELLQSVPSDLEDLFYRHGVKSFTWDGETFEPTRQRVLKVVETTEQYKDKTIAERLRPGYEWDGKVIRPEMVIAYIYKNEEGKKENQ